MIYIDITMLQNLIKCCLCDYLLPQARSLLGCIDVEHYGKRIHPSTIPISTLVVELVAMLFL